MLSLESASDPRTQIRGLIEARRCGLSTGPARPPIRGLRSAASLKLALGRLVRAAQIIDPRTQIRGLIEATSPARRRPPAAAPIRGLRSAASLKHLYAAAVAYDSLPIRGLRSAASLKLIAPVVADDVPPADPRTQIRGLIEAGPGSC